MIGKFSDLFTDEHLTIFSTSTITTNNTIMIIIVIVVTMLASIRRQQSCANSVKRENQCSHENKSWQIIQR